MRFMSDFDEHTLAIANAWLDPEVPHLLFFGCHEYYCNESAPGTLVVRPHSNGNLQHNPYISHMVLLHHARWSPLPVGGWDQRNIEIRMAKMCRLWGLLSCCVGSLVSGKEVEFCVYVLAAGGPLWVQAF